MRVVEGVAEIGCGKPIQYWVDGRMMRSPTILDVLHRASNPADHAFAKRARRDVWVVGDADLARRQNPKVKHGVGKLGGRGRDRVSCEE